MKKILVIVFTTILCLLLIAIAGLYWATQNQYGAQIFNQLSTRYANSAFSASSAIYHFPNQLSLENLEIKETKQSTINIKKVDVWVNLSSLLSDSVIVDSLLLNGISLQSGLPSLEGLDGITLKQISISNLDYSDDNIIARDANIQIKDPIFSSEQLIPFGNIQFSAAQLYWQGEAFDNILIDADYKAQHSTVYGASFKWRDGGFSGQAEQFDQGWSLVNVTIDQLRLSDQEWRQAHQVNWSLITDSIMSINSLDMLDSTVEFPQFQLTNANLSIENILLPFEVWQQSDGYFSLSAESINVLNQQWIEPVFELYLDNNLLTLEEGSTEFQQGFIQGNGVFTPDSAHLSHLSISGLKWINEEETNSTPLPEYLTNLANVKVDNLQVKHTQFIQLNKEHNWQVSDLNMSGSNVELLKEGEMALWDGKLAVSANNMSYDQIYSSHPVVNMSNTGGIWSLNDLFIPLENGLIEASGWYQISKTSRPWKLKANVYGLPAKIYQSQIDLPFQLDGLTDFRMDVSGLAADKLSFHYALSGELIATFRDSTLTHRNEASTSVNQDIDLSDLRINADRGRITIDKNELKGTDVTGKVSGQYDFIDKNKNQLQLEVEEKCHSTTFDLLSNKAVRKTTCQPKVTPN